MQVPVGAPGTILYGRKGRTRKEDKIVLDLYVDTKFVDREKIQGHEDTWPFMSDNIDRSALDLVWITAFTC